jgi:lipopolysaccharide/colanic/teichoic acid biosynthesis glycosyltransferase
MGFPDLKTLDSDPSGNGYASDPSGLLPEPMFLRALGLERKRAERSRKPFVLMLLELSEPLRSAKGNLLKQAVPALLSSIRETDIAGWHRENLALAVIFAELGVTNRESSLAILRARVTSLLQSALSAEELARIRITFHCFPDDWAQNDAGPTIEKEKLYPDVVKKDESRQLSRALKRTIDVLGSALGLLLLAPVLVLIALAIRVSSPGPILFRQKRIGRYGVPFTCLKFRSMHTGNDPRIHMEYVKQLIGGNASADAAETNGRVYKITADPRLTRVGRFLRKTSLDEVPQLLNVLRGDMSMVGPRPPIPYEFEVYDVWHRRRLLEVRPGITGLWQVSGRSRIPFDDMVRLDLRYAKTWSLWLDFQILLRTPRAVFSGEGAY